jgi:hypothetical protein
VQPCTMATSGRASGVVGYNGQVAVDTEHHLIVVSRTAAQIGRNLPIWPSRRRGSKDRDARGR